MNAGGYMPHGMCYLWNLHLILLHVLSDGLIAGAYFSIPVALAIFLRKRRDLPFPWIFAMFGTFIAACGATHVMGIWTIWHPDFWLDGWIKAFTAGISVVTAVVLYPLIPRAIALPSAAEIDERSRSEDFLRLVVEAAPNAMIVVDPVGCIQLINAQVERLFGYTRDELMGKSVEMLLPERFAVGHHSLRAAYLAAPTTRSMGAGRDLFGLRKDGSEVPIEIGLNPMSTHDGEFVLASIIDITERTRAEQHLRLVVEAAPNAMVVVDQGGRITLINAQLERLFGYTRAELLGESVEKLVPTRFHDAHPGLRRGYHASMKTRAMGAGRDLFGLRKDGSEVPIEIGLNPMKTPEGDFVLAAIIDITERKRAEELRLINAGIHQQNTQLENLNKELESFSYSVSHDLRAPVRAIIGYSEVIEKEYGATLDAEGRRLLGVVCSESARMGELIDDLLQFSALNRKAIERTLVDMTALVKEVCREQLPAEKAGKTILELDVLPPAHGDRVLLRQVWENLISNALKYSGGSDAPRLHVSGWLEGQYAVYRVQDNGVGFDMKYYDKLFGVFARLHHADEFPGTGVGLAIVQRIVSRHGGRVWAQAALGEGATFSFSLPLGESRE